MPFFKVVSESKSRCEMIVEAENMDAAIHTGLQAVRMTKIKAQPYFDRVEAEKVADIGTVGDVMGSNGHFLPIIRDEQVHWYPNRDEYPNRGS